MVTSPAGNPPGEICSPSHSPLGGSAAERYLKCSASVELIRLLGLGSSDDEVQEEYTAEGTVAHSLVAYLLDNAIPEAWPFVNGGDRWEAVTDEMARHAQAYIDYVRSRGGRLAVEHKMRRPEIHQYFYGTIDCAIYGVLDDRLEIVDFKYGKGVVVSPVRNAQLMYYAIGFIAEARETFPDEMRVRLTIAQPRAYTEAFRSWDTSVGELMAWLADELLPGMNDTQQLGGWFFDMGEHCRFCPGKLACPAFANLSSQALVNAGDVSGTLTAPKTPPGWRPVLDAAQLNLLQMYISAARKWMFGRLQGGASPEEVGAKLIFGKADRVWKDGAEERLALELGEAAYVRKLISPAQAEDIGAKALVAELAYKPDGKPTVAPLDHTGVEYGNPRSASSLMGRHAQKALAQSA